MPPTTRRRAAYVGDLTPYRNEIPQAAAAAAFGWVFAEDPKWGADPTGVADSTTAVKAVIAAGQGSAVYFGAGRTYKITSQVDFTVGRTSYIGNRTVFNCAAVPAAAGYAVRFIPDTTSSTDTFLAWCQGLSFVGPRNEANNLDGVFIGRPADGAGDHVAGFKFENVKFQGFRDNVVFGDKSWLNQYINVHSLFAWRSGFDFSGGGAGDDAGENYNFHGGVCDRNRHTAGTAVDFRLPLAANADVHVYGMSFDYGDKVAVVESGFLGLHGCHLENRAGTNSMIDVTATGGYEPGMLNLLGCTIGGTETTPATGRASFVTVAGDRAVVQITGGKWGRYGRPDSELVTVTSGNPLVKIDGVDPIVQANAAPKLSDYTNRLVNGGFEAGLTGWRLAATVNHLHNNGLTGAAAGTPGTKPNGWADNGALNGLTVEIVSVDFTTGQPTLVVKLSGTPTASGSFGYYLDGSASIPAAVGQTWTFSTGLRAVGALTGISAVNLTMTERLTGSSTGFGGTTAAVTTARARYTMTRTNTGATTAHIQPSVTLSYTNGVAVNATIAIDTPMMTLEGDPLTPVYLFSSGATLSPARHLVDTTTFRSGAAALSITNTGTGNYGVYQDVLVVPGGRLLVRGHVKANVTAGGAGLRVDWLDAAGNTISSATVGEANVTATADWAQRANTYRVPTGAVTARVWAWSAALNGQAWFDDIAAWPV